MCLSSMYGDILGFIWQSEGYPIINVLGYLRQYYAYRAYHLLQK